MSTLRAVYSSNDHDSRTISGELRSLLALESGRIGTRLHHLANELFATVDEASFNEFANMLVEACARLYEIGESTSGIALGKRIAARAEETGNLAVQRRIANVLGAQHCDIVDYAASMAYLEQAVALARRLNSAVLEAACLANVVGVLQDMGHYRQAIAMADRVLAIDDTAPTARVLKLQCASIGLFSAHRVGDEAAAARFIEVGQIYVEQVNDPLRLAFFEKNRALYLVDLGRTAEARRHLNATLEALAKVHTPKTRILTSIASAICEWADGEAAIARTRLLELYNESRFSKFYHPFVLQALVKVYSDADSSDDVALGMNYARELVEYTTSVKKAKFYRQLATKKDAADAREAALHTATAVDVLKVARDWLITSDIKAPPDDSERRDLAKHEELTAIHEDMAKFRSLRIRRDLRTDAVDTAENWAIAAEFFDDETGQHCYRVGHLAGLIAQQIGMQDTFSAQLEHAARLHDIGKIAVNEVILLKPGPLDATEMAAMRLHTEVGAQILAGSDDPTLRMATEIARHHHEWWNGAGYPARLAGKAIPLPARLCAFADVYDALTHARAYKKAWTHERAVDEITRLSGTQFDPGLLPAFTAVLQRYRHDLESHSIAAFADMDSNALIASRRRLMETIGSAAG